MNTSRLMHIFQRIANNKTLLAIVLVFLIALVAYSNSFHCAFHFDDFRDIRDNTAIRNISNIASWWKMYPSRALAMGTFALNYWLHGNNVFGFHIINFLIHVINGLLVFWLIRQTFRTYRFLSDSNEQHTWLLALIGALVFVSHPVQSQAVTYIVQRMASLATLFYLLSLNVYIFARTQVAVPGKRILLFALSFLSALAGMLTKQIVFTLPVVVILYDLIFLVHLPFSQLLRQKKIYLLLTGLVALLLIVPFRESFNFSILFRTIPPQQGHAYAITGMSYLLTQFRVIVTYIRLLFLPINQNLDYDFPIAHHFFEWPTMLSFGFLLALFIFAIVMVHRNRFIGFGILWFFITLMVESSIIPLPNVIFEHRLYLPSIGFIFMLVGIFNISYLQKHAISTCALIILVLTTLTYQRNKVWQTELTLWTDVVNKSPDKARPQYNLGLAYHNSGDDEKAIVHLQNSIRLNPLMLEPMNLLGIIYLRQDKFDEALACFNTAIEAQPAYPEALNNRGLIYMARDSFQVALDNFNETIKADSNYALAYQNRGDVYKLMSQTELAMRDYNTAIRKDPAFARAYYKRGLLYLDDKAYNRALADFRLATTYDDKMATAFYNEGICLYQKAQFDGAIAAFTAAIEADSTHEKAYYNRSLAYAYYKKQFEKAWEDVQQAKARGYKVDMTYYNTLADHFSKTTHQ
ncbi:tetratricopeptide repeat protein [candidate division KSB1 bacterium]|nr:tetratricopeptide repeat protein [candidate division KSB1 bacterium]